MKSRRLVFLALLGTAPLLAACGSQGVQLASDDPNYQGAQLFAANCAGCHTLDVAGAQGSTTNVRDTERVDGPNFNTRKETADQVLYAIRNGGFSGAIMPENILVGEDAEKVAEFLAEYSGRQAGEAKSGADESDSGSSGGAGP